ncbi:hypothetical protein ACFOWM_03280 [Ferruginibacter yonginensis]|uniref:UbiA prenyltransferase family protein n=1 Tax=Ferruginibacter yonginensis TaxID=1310416 RepID=A0ABV8QQ07_9BACT
MRLLRFILSHSIFIAFAAVALCFQTNLLLHTAYSLPLYALVFFATLCGYNFYWLLSKWYFSKNKQVAEFIKINSSFVAVYIIGFLGCLVFGYLQLALLPYLFVGAFLTMLYALPMLPFSFSKKLQQLGFFKTLLLAFTWAYVTTILSIAFVSNISTVSIALLFNARFLFMLLLCIIFDNRDVAIDQQHGLHSLATDLKAGTIDTIIKIVFVLYCLAGILLRWYMFDDAQMFAFVLTAAVVWWVYLQSKKPQGYVFYYFFVDGLMIFTSLTTYIASIF